MSPASNTAKQRNKKIRFYMIPNVSSQIGLEVSASKIQPVSPKLQGYELSWDEIFGAAWFR